MANETKIRLRDKREPGHFWADNEIIDVFGDELGQNGISVYLTMTRYCYGTEVRLSLREIAAAARMSKDTVARSMKVLVALGLVLETKGSKAKTVSTWSLANVKALVQEYVRESVSPRDRLVQARTEETRRAARVSSLPEVLRATKENCLTVRQIKHDNENGVGPGDSEDKKICVAQDATDLSQTEGGFETDLSQNEGSHLYCKTQDTKLQNKNSPLPLSRGVDKTSCVESQDPVQQPQESEDEIRQIAEASMGRTGVADWRVGFEGVLKGVHHALFQTSISLGSKRPAHLADGAEEWYRCFDSVVVADCEFDERSRCRRLIVTSKDPRATEAGLKKYRLRIEKGMQQYFGQIVQVRVRSEERRL